MERSIVFFDIDGTLLTTDTHIIPDSAKEAIRTARGLGHILCINTGRPYSQVEPPIFDLGFDGYLCACGTYLRCDGDVLYHHQLSQELCARLVRLIRDCRLDVIYEGLDGVAFDRTRPLIPWLLAEEARFGAMGLDVHRSIEAPGFVFDKFVVWTNDDPHCDFPKFKDFIRDKFDLIDRGGRMYEVVPKGCSKATAMLRALDYYHIPLERSIAIGDSTNDLPMLRLARTSVAMGNAMPELFHQVSYVTTGIEEDGIANALAHLGLLG